MRLGPWEIALIVGVILILFGPRKLPELGRGIGQFLTNLKKSASGDSKDKTEENKAA